jgi:protein-tyrosine-phosphatase
MAEQVLRRMAEQRELSIETASCGTAAEPYYQVPESVHRLFKAEGFPPFEHKARLATRAVLGWGDDIFVMTATHHDQILDAYPEFSSRVRLLREAAGFGEQDVEDPMGRSDEVFAQCLALIRQSLEAIVAKEYA